jgi:hypothetical protein
MSRLGVAAVVALVATVGLVSNANAVPSFVKMTGLTCNQCHIYYGGPDFTYTGKKFRLNGYRTPYVAEKIEAGEEGALNGKRLALGLISPLSFRIGSTLLAQSKPASQVVGGVTVPTSASSVTNQPFTNWAMFYVGGIGDHIGFWNETYFREGNTAASSTYRVMGMDEWDLKFVFNPGYDNIVGFATTSQNHNYLAGFGPSTSGAAGYNLNNNGTGRGSHAPYGNIAAYALIKDRFLVIAGVQGGEDNYSLSGANYLGSLGIAIMNSDYNSLWLHVSMKAGNDAVPLVSSMGLTADVSGFTYSDAFNGVSATRGNTAATRVAYRAADVGDILRSVYEVEYSFVDRGKHSWWSSVGIAYNKETYADGASYKSMGWGFNIHYMYDRTWGVVYGKNKYMTNEFTDKNGVAHDISSAPLNPFSGTFQYRPAQNFTVNLGWGFMSGGGSNRLDDTRVYNKDGWNWSLAFNFLF